MGQRDLARQAGLRVPADRDGAWDFTDEGISDFPYYLAMMIAKDGVGDQTVYRVEAAYKMKVTAKTDRTVARRTGSSSGSRSACSGTSP